MDEHTQPPTIPAAATTPTATWTEIADRLGISRQAARQRWNASTHTDGYPGAV